MWVLGEAVLPCTHIQCFEHLYKNIFFFSMNFEYLQLKKSLYNIAWVCFHNGKACLYTERQKKVYALLLVEACKYFITEGYGVSFKFDIDMLIGHVHVLLT